MLTVTERLLTDGSVSLRENSPTDSEMLYRGRMAPLSRSMFLNTEVIPYEAHESMIQKYFRADTKDCWFVIESAQKPVGTIALYNFEDHGRRSEWGRFVIAWTWIRTPCLEAVNGICEDVGREVGALRSALN